MDLKQVMDMYNKCYCIKNAASQFHQGQNAINDVVDFDVLTSFQRPYNVVRCKYMPSDVAKWEDWSRTLMSLYPL